MIETINVTLFISPFLPLPTQGSSAKSQTLPEHVGTVCIPQ
jgi:hypothetical protein